MFVELIEVLRCPRPHEQAQLVASASRTDARHIVDGLLGCPVCGAEFSIASGVVHFDEPAAPTHSEPPNAETAMRLSAFLALTDARGFAVLCGRWAAHAGIVRQMAETPIIALNPPTGFRADSAAGVLQTRDVVPLAQSSARAVALDAMGAPGMVGSAVRAVRPGGRVVGPAELELPAGVTEIARDALMWVGEKTAAPDPTPRLVPIRRQAR